MSEAGEKDGSGPSKAAQDPNGPAAIPGLLRLGAGAYWRTATWTAGLYVKGGKRVVSAAVSGESFNDLVGDTQAELRSVARRFLGVSDSLGVTDPAQRDFGKEAKPDGEVRDATLRQRGADLLARSADVHDPEDGHPAYERILTEISPDEGRILRLLVLEGAQPSVDVRTSRPLDIGSHLVAPGLNMIGAQSGCRHLERTPAYLNNLYRLGLIWFSREPLEDPQSYQVLEAQPEVNAAMKEAGRGKTVRRSIYLTPFGEDFCRVVLPLGTTEIDALPHVSSGGGHPDETGSFRPVSPNASN